MVRVFLLTCFVLLATSGSSSSSFAANTVDPPIDVTATKLDGAQISGRITSYDDDGFEMMDAKKNTQKITWDQLPAQKVFTLNSQLNRKPAAEDWMKLGKK